MKQSELHEWRQQTHFWAIFFFFLASHLGSGLGNARLFVYDSCEVGLFVWIRLVLAVQRSWCFSSSSRGGSAPELQWCKGSGCFVSMDTITVSPHLHTLKTSVDRVASSSSHEGASLFSMFIFHATSRCTITKQLEHNTGVVSALVFNGTSFGSKKVQFHCWWILQNILANFTARDNGFPSAIIFTLCSLQSLSACCLSQAMSDMRPFTLGVQRSKQQTGRAKGNVSTNCCHCVNKQVKKKKVEEFCTHFWTMCRSFEKLCRLVKVFQANSLLVNSNNIVYELASCTERRGVANIFWGGHKLIMPWLFLFWCRRE